MCKQPDYLNLYPYNKSGNRIAFLITMIIFCNLFISSGCQNSSSTNTSGNQQTTTETNSTAPPTSAQSSKDTTIPATDSEFILSKSGKKLPKPENNITIVNENGWNEQDMTFQLDYCMQMMASVQNLDANTFCTCFLSKIQYFYPPIYARDAYEDQQKWNSKCFEAAEQVKQ